MIVTEKEAGSKQCPFTTYCVNPHQVDVHNPIYVQSNCIGSNCMGWVWVDSSATGESRRGGCKRIEVMV